MAKKKKPKNNKQFGYIYSEDDIAELFLMIDSGVCKVTFADTYATAGDIPQERALIKYERKRDEA